ncbi:tyrosine-type recombinase/integrase [Vibrio alginolyticus]|uniref:site-specific integrase n=1 Tax=Vibrio antiquarius (strain Ex25) TaxID=150340 RepID=UPI002659F303|nr:tyrosine-type recombinase/integrase [Vibrio antiquarius]ELB2802830.1 tyrosine-type recombinase/integrase [Vibrio alginolyticus]MCR9845932.1 tyrosine-type recombinase/integrase [Vibrio antiquarius]MCR9911410.1 tyrosine-type recombinase/integrase [Vibrio antiquarius]
MYLIQSSNVYKQAELTISNNTYQCTPVKGNIGTLPTLFNGDGSFNHEANSYLFYQKAVKDAKDLNPCSQALYAYYQFLEDENLTWSNFPPVKRLKPTYLFRSHLLKQIKKGALAHSTASIRMNQIVNYYKWLMHDGYLKIKNEKEAPFKMEFVSVQSSGMLAHISPTFTIETSDLRIKVPKYSDSSNIRPLTPLSQESLSILTQYLPNASEELRLQVLLSIDSGMRIQEIATLSIGAVETATPIAESEHRFELSLSPQTTGVMTKHLKSRKVEISAELLSALNDYRISERRLKRVNKLDLKLEGLPKIADTLKQEAHERLVLSERHEPLFVSEQGNPVTAKSIEARWTELRSKIKKTHPTFSHRFHDLRSTYATYRLSDLLGAGCSPSECIDLLMGWMGHRNESTTWKYLCYLQRKEAFKVKFGILDSIMHEALGGEDE